jgi:hypothetical protein
VFRSAGPLVFDTEVTRFIGDKEKLLANGLIADTALLRMPIIGDGSLTASIFVKK